MAFPNFEDKHAEDALFSPSDYFNYLKKEGKYPDFKVPEAVIFCYQRKLLNHVLENHKTTKVDFLIGESYVLDETDGQIVIIGKFGIGAPTVTTILEECIAFGVKKFISIGTAGTLQKDIPFGSLVVCDKAIRDEGTSYHYIPASKYSHASKAMTQKIIDSLNKFNQEHLVGTSWTTDAPYRETVAEARQYQKEGVLTVEMEASALFTVAQFRGVELGSLFTVSDSLADLEWNPHFYGEKTQGGLETIYKVAIDALSK